MPVNGDVLSVQVILAPEQDDHVNRACVKDLGELDNVGTNATTRSSTPPASAFASCRCA
jgi:hypothetical protein